MNANPHRDDAPEPPRLAIIAGSGSGGLAARVEVGRRVAFRDIPGMIGGAGTGAGSELAGHAREWITGTWSGVPLHFLAGRRHSYEGGDGGELTCGARLLAERGVRVVILLNAAGGLSPHLEPGAFMLIRDHLDLNPGALMFPAVLPARAAAGPPRRTGSPWSPEAAAMMRRAALGSSIDLREGVYAFMRGPSFETPAEAAMLRRLGGDAVGMSTIPEAETLARAGVRVVGISLITNSHVERLRPERLTHDEVLETGRAQENRLADLIEAALPSLARLASLPPVRA